MLTRPQTCKPEKKEINKVNKVRVEPKTIGIAAVTHNRYTTRPTQPRCSNDKLTFSFELCQARRIRSHFLFLKPLSYCCRLRIIAIFLRTKVLSFLLLSHSRRYKWLCHLSDVTHTQGKRGNAIVANTFLGKISKTASHCTVS